MNSQQHNDELFLAIGRLEGKVDSLLSMQGHQQEQIKDHDNRLRELEHARSFIIGGAGAVSAAVSLLIHLFSK
jgi:hypothetical protein